MDHEYQDAEHRIGEIRAASSPVENRARREMRKVPRLDRVFTDEPPTFSWTS
jgi:hypothetical protein